MLPVIWKETAIADLSKIVEYIGEHNPKASHSLLTDIQAAALLLADHPYMHKAGRVVGTREVVVTTNYLLIYKVEADRVDILNVLHSRQAYP